MTRAALGSLFLLTIAFAACSAAPQTTHSTRDKDDPSSSSSSGNGSGNNNPDDQDDPSNPNNPSNPTRAGAACADTIPPQIDTTTLDPFFTTKMKEANVPGLSVAVIGGGKIKWAKGYGFANVAQQKPVTSDTLFMLASVSKTITSVALMQLIEDPARGLSLDQDVSTKLPFTVRNPNFASTPITFRMLLTHTSSLIDSDDYWAIAEPDPLVAGDSPIKLLDFDRDYVAKTNSWDTATPGTKYTYSNTAVSLIGLLVEQISGKDLQVYSKTNIFDRINMKEASFFLKDLDPSHIATPYDLGAAQPHYGYPDYPAGQVRTSAPQLARFLIMFSQNGECGQRVLKQETVKAMETLQVPNVEPSQALIWYYDTKGGSKVIGHNGGDKGVSTDMFFDPATGRGYVLLSNGSTNVAGVAKQEAAMAAMNDKLMDLAKTLP